MTPTGFEPVLPDRKNGNPAGRLGKQGKTCQFCLGNRFAQRRGLGFDTADPTETAKCSQSRDNKHEIT